MIIMSESKAKVFFIDGTIEVKNEMTTDELKEKLIELGFDIRGEVEPFASKDIQKAMDNLVEDTKSSPAIAIEDLDTYFDSLPDSEDDTANK